jgi:hypothetical protein
VWISIQGAPHSITASICSRLGSDFGQPGAGLAHLVELPGHVEPPFGGQLFAFLGHQAYVLRREAATEVQHFPGDCHFQVQLRIDHLLEQQRIAFLDVTPILPYMEGDRIGARVLGYLRRVNRIRKPRTAGLAQRGDMVDIHAQCDQVSHFRFAISW